MTLTTVRGDTTVCYREERIPRFDHVVREHYDEVCEHLVSGGVHVQIVWIEDDHDWD